MPRYMLLIHSPAEGGPGPEALAEEMPRWFAYTEELREAGAFVAGEALEPAEAARSVRIRHGARTLASGPVGTGPDVLGGFYLIDVADLAAAEDWAARMPNAHYGVTEVRPAMVFADVQPERATAASGSTT